MSLHMRILCFSTVIAVKIQRWPMWLSWLERCPMHRKVTPGLTPHQGTHPGYGVDPRSGSLRMATNQCFSLTSMFLCLSLSPSHSFKKKKKKQWKMYSGDDKIKFKKNREWKFSSDTLLPTNILSPGWSI